MPLNVETQAGDEAPLRQKEIISLAAKTRSSQYSCLFGYKSSVKTESVESDNTKVISRDYIISAEN